MSVKVFGHVAPEFAAVRNAFGAVLVQQNGPGAALAIWRNGEWVADVWGGWAGAARPWDRDTIVQPYSASKPFVACCALILVDRGLLDLDAPVQRYWPEFRTRTTVRELLSHQSGVVALTKPAPTESFYDWDALCGLLADQEPEWEPGSRHGESALFYGHLVGELVRRVDGRLPGEFLRAEVTGPLGLDFQFGLTVLEQSRAADLCGFTALTAMQQREHPPDSTYWHATSNPPGSRDAEIVNSSRWRAAQIPAINGHGTARAMAEFYVVLQRGEILSEPTLREACTAQTVGVDAVFGHVNSWGLGFGIDDDGYGMGGLGGSYAGYSVAGDYAIAFVTAFMDSHDRLTLIENAFRATIGLAPVS